jgi:hypothetical protein
LWFLAMNAASHIQRNDNTTRNRPAQVGSDKRDRYIDSWRGIFHVVLTLDHLPFLFPAISYLLGGLFQPLGYVSVAEGFVFLSGYVSGLVYTRVRREQGAYAVWRKVLLRSRDIFGCYVLAVVTLVSLIRSCGESNLDWGSWKSLLVLPLPLAAARVILLLTQPAFLEILPMYCLFLLFVPSILRQLERGCQMRVAIISMALWSAAQFGIRKAWVGLIHPWISVEPGYFDSFGWQILFVAGLICGHKTFSTSESWLPNGRILLALTYGVALGLFALRHGFWRLLPGDMWIGGAALGPLRLLNFACVAYLISRYRDYIEKCIAWKGFAFLSRHSLQVFAFHLFPMCLLSVLLKQRLILSVSAQLFFVFFSVSGLFIIAFISQSLKDRRNHFRTANN